MSSSKKSSNFFEDMLELGFSADMALLYAGRKIGATLTRERLCRITCRRPEGLCRSSFPIRASTLF
jgi:hypothetical protein